ncbi:MAG: hypothetical protein ACLSGS_05955 [Adlercreutzia sp.]
MTMRRIDLQPLEPFTSDFIDRTGAFNPGALEAATAIIEQVRQEATVPCARLPRSSSVAIRELPRAARGHRCRDGEVDRTPWRP